MVSCMRKTPWLHLGPLCWGLTARHKPEGSSSAVRNHAPSWSREALCRPVCVLADTVSCRQTASCGGAPSCRERGAERQRRGPGSVWLGRQPCRAHTPPPEHLSPSGRAASCSIRRPTKPCRRGQLKKSEELDRGGEAGPALTASRCAGCVVGEPKPGPKQPRRGGDDPWSHECADRLLCNPLAGWVAE